jgi:hypothetical protein
LTATAVPWTEIDGDNASARFWKKKRTSLDGGERATSRGNGEGLERASSVNADERPCEAVSNNLAFIQGS